MSTLLETIFAFPNARIVVVGDLMLDRFVFGDVRRVSPEAPIPVIHVTGEDVMLGGAGNVACNIARMSGHATLISVLGDDAAGAILEDAAAREARLYPLLVRDRERRTIIKTRFVAQGQQLLRVDEEAPAAVGKAVAEQLFGSLTVALGGAKVLVCSDYAKGVLADTMLGRTIREARARGVTVIVDPKGRDFSRYAGATIITPNALEAAQATGLNCDDDEGVTAAARAIADTVGCNVVIVTRGADGMSVYSTERGKGQIVHLPTVALEVHDVSGAGDTVIAALALAVAVGASIEDAARLANIAAGVAVGKVGTAPVGVAELAHAVQVCELLHENAKVVGLDAACAAAKSWRLQGRRVVFTNGCFDLLHPGHVRLLERARAEGDKLIVALNSDESVRRLKGPNRPIQNEAARAIVMASIGVVDLVTMFSEDTPLNAIDMIAPDVLVKGADYTEDQVVGGDLVRARGGRVVLVPLEAGHSTTGAIRKVSSESSDA
ncbi:MAG: D-glycero-beta-D-manno-heptose-7-phosphate kinase [Rhizomicrobium sp.]|jgi:D-beta-D-heptose 7-phosphate kinase/D-beta-D-heptose 1-phosphate adenosyltransferase